MTKLSARERVRILLLWLVIAAAALFFCSKSSPAYPINDWSDANIYFSAGKGMLAGRVMYRDLYDHKGPLIYALHALCALACPADFTGVWVLEILFAAVEEMGSLPRKTFSMGEAHEKRYYMEARKLER